MQVSEIVKDQGLDLLINNAGIYPPLDADVSKAIAMRQFEVNAVGPLLVAQVSLIVEFEIPVAVSFFHTLSPVR